jgi:hypothetical protein
MRLQRIGVRTHKHLIPCLAYLNGKEISLVMSDSWTIGSWNNGKWNGVGFVKLYKEDYSKRFFIERKWLKKRVAFHWEWGRLEIIT